MSETMKKKAKENEAEAVQTEQAEDTCLNDMESIDEASNVQQESQQEIDALTAENQDLQDKLLRQMAEFDNYRKRTIKERAELYDDATAKCLSQIVTILDNFERALQTPSEGNEDYKKGVQMIFDQLTQILTGMGVSEIDAQGKPFDPEFHNAVSSIADEAFEDNTVCQVYQKGYLYKGKVIRHAMVAVANS